MLFANLAPAFDAFLEATTAAQKWRIVRPLEAKLQKAMRKAFTAQGNAFLDGLAARRGEFSEALTQADWLQIFDQAAALTYNLFLDPLEATAIAGLTAGATAVIADLEIATTFDLANPRAVQYINAHGAETVTGLEDVSRDRLRTLLAEGLDEGWSYNKTAREIRALFTDMSRTRSTVIATYESGMAYESGSFMVAQDLSNGGLVIQKQWLSVNDAKVEQHCLDNQAQGWIPFDEPYSDGSMHPLSHPNCRCTNLLRRAPS